jgi:preprotein translocase subunit SecG
MLSGLLVIFVILVCIALIGVVLLQRSEGGAFGMGGGPTGLITARGAGDLLTRTTWVLFALFIGLCLTLTLLGEHDRASSSLLERMKQEIANPAALDQPKTPPAPAPTPPPLGEGSAAPGVAPATPTPPAAHVPASVPAPAQPAAAKRPAAAKPAAPVHPVLLDIPPPPANLTPSAPAPPKSDSDTTAPAPAAPASTAP